jgi:hypothetical protein
MCNTVYREHNPFVYRVEQGSMWYHAEEDIRSEVKGCTLARNSSGDAIYMAQRTPALLTMIE